MRTQESQALAKKSQRTALTKKQVKMIVNLSNDPAITRQDIADEFGVSKRAIEKIVKGQSWSWLTGITSSTYKPRKQPLSAEMVKQIKEMLEKKLSHRKIAEAVGCSSSTVGGIARNETHQQSNAT